MKTAEGWTQEYFGGTPQEVGEDVFDLCVDFVKRIQLDARIAGMTEAASLLNSVPLGGRGMDEPYLRMARDTILAARDQLKEGA